MSNHNYFLKGLSNPEKVDAIYLYMVDALVIGKFHNNHFKVIISDIKAGNMCLIFYLKLII